MTEKQQESIALAIPGPLVCGGGAVWAPAWKPLARPSELWKYAVRTAHSSTIYSLTRLGAVCVSRKYKTRSRGATAYLVPTEHAHAIAGLGVSLVAHERPCPDCQGALSVIEAAGWHLGCARCDAMWSAPVFIRAYWLRWGTPELAQTEAVV